jgi:predicted nucleotide-binding protein
VANTSELLSAIRKRSKLGERQIQRKIEEEATRSLLPRPVAIIRVAAGMGINVSRYATPEELALARGVSQPISSPSTDHVDAVGAPRRVTREKRSAFKDGWPAARKRTTARSERRAAGCARDAKRVFVVYGRNTAAYDAMVLFLQALRLHPRDFLEIRNDLRGAPFIGDIVYEGISQAQATIVVFTPDEAGALHPDLLKPHDPDRERLRWQSRANVILEAGMALALDEKRTILCTIGSVVLPSDLDGRHVLRLNNSVDQRKALKEALEGVECDVEDTGRWHDPAIGGDFEACVRPPRLRALKPHVDFNPRLSQPHTRVNEGKGN